MQKITECFPHFKFWSIIILLKLTLIYVWTMRIRQVQFVQRNIPLQNCQALPFQEKAVDTKGRGLPSQFPNHRVHQLKKERKAHTCLAIKWLWIKYKKESENMLQLRYKPKILHLLGSESILAPKLLHKSLPTCCIPSFNICKEKGGNYLEQELNGTKPSELAAQS